ncbi:GNAT family N-acetyltransferase [Trinickia mobilis]|uniref:GNAT family N-acetyltransferase n=1 Tax=Trinickia mobilis TaxID=2816356 RepID=UPI001A8EC71D|nr:GNAT family N-acetyltransferase [Trinickia mobilis]
MVELRHLQVNEEKLLIPMLKKMYASVAEEDLASRYSVIANSAWRCVGAFCSGELIGMAGYWVNTRFYCGRYMYVDHFYIDQGFRREGLAPKFMQFLRDRAREDSCEQLCLDTFVSNQIAQKLWFKEGFSIVGFHFVHPLWRCSSRTVNSLVEVVSHEDQGIYRR